MKFENDSRSRLFEERDITPYDDTDQKTFIHDDEERKKAV